jgi:hypothetical protein
MTNRTSDKLVGSGIGERKRSFRHFDVDNLEQSGALKNAFSRMVAVAADPWARLTPVFEGAELQLKEMEESGRTTEEDVRERHGMGWYLRQLLMHAKLVRHHIDAGNASWAAIEALAVGDLISEMGIKHDWEADALSGRKSRHGAESTRKGSQENRVSAVDELCSPSNPNRIKKTAAFAVVAERERVTAKTIETDYYKAKRKAS